MNSFHPISFIYARRIKSGNLTLEELEQKVQDRKVSEEIFHEIEQILNENKE